MSLKPTAQPIFFLFVGILGICVVWSYVSAFSSHQEIPHEAYTKAFDTIATRVKPGDLVLVHPPWRHDVIQQLQKSHQDKAAYTLVLPAGAITSGQVFVLKDKNAPPLSKRILEMTTLKAIETVDDIEIHSLKSTLTESGLNFLSMLPMAKVEVIKKNGVTTACRWQNTKRRFTCPGMPNWVYVGPHKMKSGKTQKSCIWSHPAKNATLKIAFPNPPPNSQIYFEHALSTNAVRSDNKSPVVAAIFADEAKIKKMSRGNQTGFAATTINLPSRPTQNLTLEITAKNDGARHYCFNLKAKTKETHP